MEREDGGRLGARPDPRSSKRATGVRRRYPPRTALRRSGPIFGVLQNFFGKTAGKIATDIKAIRRQAAEDEGEGAAVNPLAPDLHTRQLDGRKYRCKLQRAVRLPSTTPATTEPR
jgi:hypothetical protein